MMGTFLVFCGVLRRNNTLVTAEGSIHHIQVATDGVLYSVHGFFLVEKRGRNHYIKKFVRRLS